MSWWFVTALLIYVLCGTSMVSLWMPLYVALDFAEYGFELLSDALKGRQS